jgi:hypothetical protein
VDLIIFSIIIGLNMKISCLIGLVCPMKILFHSQVHVMSGK